MTQKMVESNVHTSKQPQDTTSNEDVFQSFKRTLPENCVEYMLFILEPGLVPTQSFSSLEVVRKAAVQLANQLSEDYIWQREAFGLEIKSTDGLHCLYGITDYGDCVEDEWLIVYILRELTKQLPNLWIRVSDSDGEFLLVEAANVLPKWLSPENDANRAWMHAGQLHIIPCQSASDGQPDKITLPEAVRLLRSAPDTVMHSPLVEAEAFYRLQKYPGQIQESIHYAIVTIPRQLARVLHDLPKAIAPAVEAFYLRDPVSLKSLMSASTDRLSFPPTDLVDLSVKFTKVLYAQLKSQQFAPPPAWRFLLTASEKEIPSGGNETAQKEHSMLELGMKVTCGFEMLATGAAKSNDRTTREFALLLEDLTEDGPSALPSDAEISSWKDHTRNDDDSWMDINFEDFEKELDGKIGSSTEKTFGNTNTQADLRKIVSRFEAFLNDKKAGVDGAEFDEMDEDDEDSDADDESEGEDRDVSFDEEEFARMMREMMGLPAEEVSATKKGKEKGPVPDPDSGAVEEDSEDEEIRQLSEQMAAELHEHGALQLDSTPTKLKALKGKGKERAVETPGCTAAEGADEDKSEDEEVDIDYNLAKNLLESFKGQAGLMGPVGTMLADMGLRLPRDEDDDDDA